MDYSFLCSVIFFNKKKQRYFIESCPSNSCCCTNKSIPLVTKIYTVLLVF